MSGTTTQSTENARAMVFDRRREALTLARRASLGVSGLVGLTLIGLSVFLDVPWLPLPLALVVAAIVAAGGILMTRGSDSHARVVADETGLAIDGPVGVVRVPYAAIHGLRHTGDAIELLDATGRTLGELNDVLIGELDLHRRIAKHAPIDPPHSRAVPHRPGYARLEGSRLVRPEAHDDRPIELDEVRRVELLPATANEVVGALVLDLHLDARRVVVTTDVGTGIYVLAVRGGDMTEAG